MRLIDADALGKTDRPVGKLMMFGGEYVYTQTEIDRAPTIDAVPVVRCRECEHWETDWKPHGFNPDNPRYFCGYCELFAAGDWFCADGQRREDGDVDV